MIPDPAAVYAAMVAAPDEALDEVAPDAPVEALAEPAPEPAAPAGEGTLPPPHWLTQARRLIAPEAPPSWTWRHPVAVLRWYGGSWLRRVWAFVLFVAVVVLTILGTVTLLSYPHKPAAAPVIPPAPDPIAQSYALRIARLFLTTDPETMDARATQVAALAPGAPLAFGWDGKSRSTVTDVWLIADQPDGPNRMEAVGVIANGTARTVLVRVGRDPATGAPFLLSVPALGSAPTVARAQPETATAQAGSSAATAAATAAARPAVEGFLRAWGADTSDLLVYAAEGWRPPPGPGNLRLDRVEFSVPDGTGTRQIIARVRWLDRTGAAIPSAYALTITTTGQRWAISGIDPAPSTSFYDLPS